MRTLIETPRFLQRIPGSGHTARNFLSAPSIDLERNWLVRFSGKRVGGGPFFRSWHDRRPASQPARPAWELPVAHSKKKENFRSPSPLVP